MPCRWGSKTRKFGIRAKLIPKKIIKLNSRAFAFCQSDIGRDACVSIADVDGSCLVLRLDKMHGECGHLKFLASCWTMLSTQVNGYLTRICRCMILLIIFLDVESNLFISI